MHSLVAEDIIVFDAAAILTANGRANPDYYVDELHLSDAGYAVLNQELERVLNDID